VVVHALFLDDYCPPYIYIHLYRALEYTVHPTLAISASHMALLGLIDFCISYLNLIEFLERLAIFK